jgi:hypothetical protein
MAHAVTRAGGTDDLQRVTAFRDHAALLNLQ